MWFKEKCNKADLIVTKKLPHTTAAVEAVSKLVCAISEKTEAIHIAGALADITKKLAEAERAALLVEVVRYDGSPLGKRVFLEEEKKGNDDRQSPIQSLNNLDDRII